MRRMVGTAVVALVCAMLLSSCALLKDADPDGTVDAEMQHISSDVKHHDAAALEALFSKTARAEAPDLDTGLRKFLSVFPSGFKNLGEPAGGPGEEDESKDGNLTVLLQAVYEVRAGGKTYDLFFADYTEQAIDSNDVGLSALGIAPYNAYPTTKPTAASNAFYNWSAQYGIKSYKAIGTPSVFVYEPPK